MSLNNAPKLDYNRIAMNLEDENFDGLFLMFWLRKLSNEEFWRLPEDVGCGQYTPALGEYLQKTNLLDEYARDIPGIYRLRAEVEPTGVYSGWDEQRSECEVQFCEGMDKTLLWILDQLEHLIALHQIAAPDEDLARWACKRWLHYHLSKYANDSHQTRDGDRGFTGSGETSTVSNEAGQKLEPPSRQEADDTIPSP